MCTPLFAPIASALRNALLAAAGPTVSATTSASRPASTSRTACSTAYSSNSLSRPSTASRSRVKSEAKLQVLVGSGTYLTGTTIFITSPRDRWTYGTEHAGAPRGLRSTVGRHGLRALGPRGREWCTLPDNRICLPTARDVWPSVAAPPVRRRVRRCVARRPPAVGGEMSVSDVDDQAAGILKPVGAHAGAMVHTDPECHHSLEVAGVGDLAHVRQARRDPRAVRRRPGAARRPRPAPGCRRSRSGR